MLILREIRLDSLIFMDVCFGIALIGRAWFCYE